MKLSKITHHNELRIFVEFPYDAAKTERLRQIPDTRWSRMLKSWHVPYTKEVFAQLKALFPEVEYISDVETRHATSLLKKAEPAIPIKPETAPKEAQIVPKQ